MGNKNPQYQQIALNIKINRVIIIVTSLRGIAESKNAPTEKAIYAIKSSFPLSFTSESLDFRERLANKIPLITTTKRNDNRNIIIKEVYLTSTGGFNAPIKFGFRNRKVKKRISKIAPIMTNIERINLRFSEYKNSVKANNQRTIAKGTNIFPITKYTSRGIPTPLPSATKKDMLELHQLLEMNIHVVPTYKYTRSLYL
ncbi:MAG: hypothetical protein ACFE8C_06255 [Promethearchaeota archaeon]